MTGLGLEVTVERISDVFECVLSLRVLQPVRRPAGFDAGPLLQQSVILSQFRVMLGRQPTEQKVGDIWAATWQTAHRIITYVVCATSRKRSKPLALTQIWKEWQPLEKRSHLPARRTVLRGESSGPAWKKEAEHFNTLMHGEIVCVCVFTAHTLPSAGNPPRAWVQWSELPCFSSELSHASLLQGQTSHSR